MGARPMAAAIASDNAEHRTASVILPVRYLNNVREQDHRAVKRVVRRYRMHFTSAADVACGTGTFVRYLVATT